YILSDIHSHDRQIYGRFHGGVSSSCGVNELPLWHIDAVAARPQSDLMPTMAVRVETSIPSEIFISTVIRAFHAAKSHSFRTPRLSFKRSPGRRAAKASQNRLQPVAVFALQVTAVHPVICLQVSDDRLDGLASLELSSFLCRQP